MLVGNTTYRRDIPHEPGEWIMFKLLSWRALEEARTRRQNDALRSFAGVADVVAQLSSVKREDVQAADEDRATQFDRATLLRKGIAAWSYDAPVDDAALDDLDEVTAEWAVREIIALHTRTEEERLNGFFRTGNLPAGAL